MVILGVDPGLGATGYGVIETAAAPARVVVAGDIRTTKRDPLAKRLAFIHVALAQVIRRCRPQTLVLEKLFTHHHHVTTAALMAHARGMACLVAQEHGVTLVEYPPTQVKSALTGHGRASKQQVARMVGQWLGHLDQGWSADATDALALAIVHARLAAQHRRLPVEMTLRE